MAGLFVVVRIAPDGEIVVMTSAWQYHSDRERAQEEVRGWEEMEKEWASKPREERPAYRYQVAEVP